MLRDRGAANLSVWATLLDNLEITVAKFLVAIFHPKASAIDHVGQFFGIVRQKRGGFNRKRAGDDAIVKTRYPGDFVPRQVARVPVSKAAGSPA